MERDIKISECYLRLGEIGLENENYTGAIGDLLECQVLQKRHFDKLDRRIAETHYHLGSAYSFEKRYNNAKEHFEAARKVIIDKIDKLTEEFDAESEKDSSDEKLMSEKTNEIAQLKDILPDLNSKLEDIECSIKNEKFNKVQEHLDEKVPSKSSKTLKLTKYFRKPMFPLPKSLIFNIWSSASKRKKKKWTLLRKNSKWRPNIFLAVTFRHLL